MPTGYTYPIIEKSAYSFKEYAMDCARAFGACILMRDDPKDTPIPEKFEPSDYNQRASEQAKRKLSELSAMTQEEQVAFGQSASKSAITHALEYLNKQKAENAKLDAMAKKVEAWAPPTEKHKGLKKFMLEQIAISKNKIEYSMEGVEQAKARLPLDFYDDALADAKRSIEYHTKANEKEIQRANSRTEWVQKLRESLQ